MRTAMTDAEFQSRLSEYEDLLRKLTSKCEELAAANSRLMAECSAHQTLRSLYGDPTQPATVRLRAAAAAINVETPRLTPQSAPLDLVGEEVEDLATLVHRRRARQDALQLEGRDIEVSDRGIVRILPKPDDGNGSDRS